MEILTELLRLAEEGNLVGLAYIAEVRGDPVQKFGALLAFDTEAHRGMVACSRLWAKLRRNTDIQEAREQASG